MRNLLCQQDPKPVISYDSCPITKIADIVKKTSDTVLTKLNRKYHIGRVLPMTVERCVAINRQIIEYLGLTWIPRSYSSVRLIMMIELKIRFLALKQVEIDASRILPVLARFIGKKQSLLERTRADDGVAKRALFTLKSLRFTRVELWNELSMDGIRSG